MATLQNKENSMNNIKLYNGDCLEVMDKLIEQGTKVDAIITDPPYGTTTCSWDSVIPFKAMWQRLNKLIKPNGAILLFGSEPFSSALRMSNIKNYKYDWIWEKDKGTGFAFSRKQPLRKTENISVFYKKHPIYHYKGKKLEKPIKNALPVKKSESNPCNLKNNLTTEGKRIYTTYTHKVKTNLIYFTRDAPKNAFHPTQKPVELMKYLIKTYTNENETVLDFTMGSGTTGVACRQLNRNFIGIELDKNYYEIAKKRINGEMQLNLFEKGE